MGVKCVRCQTDNNLSDRTNNQGRCKNCGHPFVFDPVTVTDPKLKFTDVFFAQAIADLSNNNSLYFTPKQFFYYLGKRLNRKKSIAGNPWIILLPVYILIGFILIDKSLKSSSINFLTLLLVLIPALVISISYFQSISGSLTPKIRRQNAERLSTSGLIILIGGILLGIIAHLPFIYLSSLILGIIAIYMGRRELERQNYIPQDLLINQSQFQTWVNRWEEINQPIEKMLPPLREEGLSRNINSDLTNYSFDRAVICDSAAIAQMLIANNFHFENNCAILSINRYPQSIFETVLEMLKRNSNLKVYALHDASPQGITLVHNLRTQPQWFQNTEIMIYDLGLTPRQILASKNISISNSATSANEAKQLSVEIRQSLEKSELDWLEAGNFVELESFSPQRILQVLSQGISRSQLTGSDSLVVVEEGYGGGYVYGYESFG